VRSIFDIGYNLCTGDKDPGRFHTRPSASGNSSPRSAATMNRTIPIWKAIGIWLFLAAACTRSFAIESDLKITQFAHAAWGANEGAPSGIQAIAQTKDGYLWFGSPEGLFRFDGMTFEQYQAQSEPPLNAGDVVTLLALPGGDLWIGFKSGAISVLRNGHAENYAKADGVPRGYIDCLAQDETGAIWAGWEYGLVRLENNRWKAVGREWNFPGTAARAIYLDRAGTLWVATENTIVFLPKGARTFQPTGIHVGQVSQIIEAPNGKLWMAETTRSVRPLPLNSKLAPSDETEVHVGANQILFAREGDLWIPTLGDGLRRVRDPEKLNGKPDRSSTDLESYTTQDGLNSNFDLSIVQDRDANIWVGSDRGLDRFRETALTGLGGISRNPRAQTPSIQSLVADGQSYLRWTDLKLPAGTKNLQILYTVVNLTAPWQVHFRYKLDGFDAHWQDAGTRRTAYYMNIGPGKYRFRVVAGDLDGAWSPNAAVIDFTIPPFWFQTAWFRVLCVVVLLLLLWTLYRLHVGQLKREFTIALGTRFDERVRIARELHDTLLQSFHGLMFQFQAARNLLPRSPESTMEALDEAILATEQAIAEGRDAIHDLRPELGGQQDLAELLTATGRELAGAHDLNGHHPGFRVIVEGKPRRLSAAVEEEIYRIGREVIRNAFRHAVANHIEVEIRYDERELRLRIRDDGKGIDPEVLEVSGRPGHWGLPGVRERTQRIGSRLEFWTEAGAGTEVELRVPAAVAYEEQWNGTRFRLFRKGGINGRSS
jgi:signal transduction histidine kinase